MQYLLQHVTSAQSNKHPKCRQWPTIKKKQDWCEHAFEKISLEWSESNATIVWLTGYTATNWIYTGFYELRIRFCMDLGLCMLRLSGSGQAPTLRHLTPSRRQLPRRHSRKKDLVQGSILLPAIPPHIIFMVAPIATPSQLESGYRPGLDVDCWHDSKIQWFITCYCKT